MLHVTSKMVPYNQDFIWAGDLILEINLAKFSVQNFNFSIKISKEAVSMAVESNVFEVVPFIR